MLICRVVNGSQNLNNNQVLEFKLSWTRGVVLFPTGRDSRCGKCGEIRCGTGDVTKKPRKAAFAICETRKHLRKHALEITTILPSIIPITEGNLHVRNSGHSRASIARAIEKRGS